MRILSRERIIGFILLISSVFISLGLAEVSLKRFWPIYFRQPPRPLREDTWRELLHQPSSVPGLAYELVPNMEKYSHGAMMRINSFGMRDKELSFKRNASTFRIAILGDSFTFGFGVSGDATYPKVLEALLNKSTDDGRQYEILNFGVGGYSTRDEVKVFKHKVLQWEPRLVIIGYVLNDPEIDPIQPLHAYYQKVRWWQYSHVLRLIVKAKYNMDVQRLGGGNYIKYLHASNDKWNSVVDAFREIRQIADTHGIRVVIVIFPVIHKSSKGWNNYPYKDIHKQVMDTVKENDFVVLDLFAAFSAYSPVQLRVSESDGHPNALGHQLAAIAIRDKLLKDDLLK